MIGVHRLPLILQAERTECGLACLAMIAGFHGCHIDLNSLRRDFPVSARGAQLGDLLVAATALQLHARPLKLDMSMLHTLELPAILHWDLKHFVVLKKVTASKLTVHDPAAGRRDYSIVEAALHFTGVAIEFSPAAGFTPRTQQMRSRLWDMFKLFPGFNAALLQLLILSLLIQLTAIGSAFYLQMVIDEGLRQNDREFLLLIALGFLMLGLTSVAMSFARSRCQLYFANQLGMQMANNVCNHLLSLPVDFFEKRHTGDLVSRFNAVQEIRRILTEDMLTALLDGFLASVTLFILFQLNSTLAMVVLLFVSIAMLFKLLLIPRLHKLQELQIIATAKTDTQFMESMRTIEIIKLYCCELPRLLLWRNLYAEQVSTHIDLARFTINVEAAYGTLLTLENILIIYLAAVLVLDGQISLGFLTAFIALRGNFSTAIRSFIEKLVQIYLLRLQLERVSDITCTEKEYASIANNGFWLPGKGNLQLQQVSFSYTGNQQLLLCNITLQINTGEIVVIQGKSGCGKSTLIKVLAGLLLPQSGQVTLDGRVLDSAWLREYRLNFAGVLQTDQLFSGSLVENITLFADQTDQEWLHKVCRLARIDEFIAALPMSYNSLVGDMGSIMSAGQAQRILLARALYRRPRILLLDEATANLDSALEEEILQELSTLGITLILVTHRPAPLAIADRVFVCTNGGLQEWEPSRVNDVRAARPSLLP